MVTKSILTSIKKLLGIAEADESFDTDIIMHINTTLFKLNQIGVGPTEGFSIEDKSTLWSDFVGSRKDIEAIKSYTYLNVRLIFDPPQMGYLVDAIKEQIKEHEWRLNVQVENTN